MGTAILPGDAWTSDLGGPVDERSPVDERVPQAYADGDIRRPVYPSIRQITVDVLHCQKCHHEWIIQKFNRKTGQWDRRTPPVQCPDCKVPRYDLPKQIFRRRNVKPTPIR